MREAASAPAASSGRLLVTPAEQQEPRRVGGISPGEGGWRLVPLAKEQACTFFVSFLPKALGGNVWNELKAAAAQDNVTISLRGLKSSGHHNSVHDHRSLTVYGIDVLKVEHHIGQILDQAVENGYRPNDIPFAQTLVAHLGTTVAEASPPEPAAKPAGRKLTRR